MFYDAIFALCFIFFIFIDRSISIVYYSLFYICPLIFIENVFLCLIAGFFCNLDVICINILTFFYFIIK